jgi:large subunit ribosomal protein L29
MAIIRIKEIRKLEEKERQKKVGELKLEFAKERANIAIGANVTSPGRLREIRKTIARIKTVENEKGGKSK